MGKFRDIWNRDLDGKNAERRSFCSLCHLRHRHFPRHGGIVRQNNIVRWIRAGLEIHNQEKLIERYSAEIKDMDRQIHGLTHSKDSLERFARENFGFAEPGDDVYIIEK